ncbi:DUF3037 domain-containing protein [Novipirellula sp.]|uniref:DUF3037 domain-containing protein n=1 Tax=Novipirellula sp. TaxID=2795430 RepID=UPI0035634512
MPKYKYSVIRFVPSPVRGEFVNLGVIIGSDQTGEWLIEVVGSKSRASRLDDDKVLPLLATDLERLQTTIESYSEPEIFESGVELSEDWLAGLSRNSRNLLQFSHPNAVVAEGLSQAFEKLWGRLIVESIPTKRNSMTKASVTAKYVTALTNSRLDSSHMKRRVKLETSKTHANIDVAVHNGVVKDITQCWSLQIKAAEPLLNEIKAWGWTIKTLRDHGGLILAGRQPIQVPNDVRVGVVYAASSDNELMDEAFDVFSDTDINADCVTVENAAKHAQVAAQLVSDQPGLDLQP